MKLKRSIVLLIALLCVVLPSYSYGQEELTARLQELDQEIEATRRNLEEISQRQASLESELKSLSQQVAALQAQGVEVEAELQRRSDQRDELDREIQATDSQILQLEGLYKKRVRALYVYGGRAGLDQIAHADNQPMLIRSAYFLSKVRAFDAAILKKIAQAQALARAQRLELDEVLRIQQELKQKVELQREQLAKRQVERQALNSQLKKERTKRESVLAGMRAQALRLETVLASLTNAGEAPEPKPAKKKRAQPKSGGFSSFEGPGLLPYKGALALPAPGTIVRSFGRKSEGGAALRKGIEIATRDTSEVAAVAPGRVLFVGRMPELNSVVIIDHGKRYYSLYGRLTEISLEVGDEVEKGDTIGKTSDPKVLSPNLYFEIRSAGLAIDPQSFFEKS
ncbi:MAG: peptidoglycan DD-metalloendopeptidase family protein [Deltaproteobacteria bacterium]|nr:peptidoglycan DD-metalloendopeptidase family protein [Deltaproteobacteria bacterium]